MNLKFQYDRFYKKLTIVGSLTCIVLFGLAALEENFLREWKNYQKEYKGILRAKAESDTEQSAAEEFPIQINQVILKDFNRVDRCVTCHNGVENPKMKGQKQPHASHSGSYIKNHAVEKFGCSICHGGQDRALAVKNVFARGEDDHWAYPLLPLQYVQSSCGKCHLAVFDEKQTLTGSDVLMKGRAVFHREGCFGCHNIRGTGGNVGLELTVQGSKTKFEYNFQHIEDERTVENWLLEHFISPQKVSGVTEMPPVNLPPDEMDALITFIMGLYQVNFPSKYLSLDAMVEIKGKRNHFSAQKTYGLMCAVCHGQNGEGKDYRVFQATVPKLNSQDFLSVASRKMLRMTIEHGRGGRNMPAWDQTHGGLSEAEIDGLTELIFAWKTEPPKYADVRAARANVAIGRTLFRSRCGTCHGANGKGGLGPSLNNQDFLSIANDRFLYETIVNGRRDTAMPSWSYLSSNEIASLLRYIRRWQTKPSTPISLAAIKGDVKNGAEIFRTMCVGCHGKYGQGSVGPAILNPDFLAAASDDFILHSISRGRGFSAMRSWRFDSQGLAQLSNPQMKDVVAYIRSHENKKPPTVHLNLTPGTPASGKVLYENMCAGCHGDYGEGKHGPALNNQEFLAAATDGFLQATIALGRSGTAMRSWAKGAQGYGELSDVQINDIVTYIRAWQKVAPGYASN